MADTPTTNTGPVIVLNNEDTGQTVTITTSNNSSTTDVMLQLPDKSGELVTEGMLETELSVIEKPMIISPNDGLTGYLGSVTSSPYATILGFTNPHEYSIWQAALDANFTKIVENYKTTACLTSINFSSIGDVYIRVKYGSGGYESLWSDTLSVNLGTIDIESAGLTSVLAEDTDNDLKFYGEVGLDKLVGVPVTLQKVNTWPTDVEGIRQATMEAIQNDTIADSVTGEERRKVMFRQYIGPITEFKRVYKPELYTVPADVPKRFTTYGNNQVSYNGKLYFAARERVPEDADSIKLPDEDPDYWKLDERNNLCSYVELMERLRFSIDHNTVITSDKPYICSFMAGGRLSAKDCNADGLSTGEVRYYPPTTINPSSDIGDMIEDQHYTYLKYWYKGKLCYTFKNPICWKVAWNDLAKLELVYGERTVRIGTNLYRVRLMTEDEYNALFGLLINKNYYTRNRIGIYDANSPIQVRPALQLIHDTRTGAVRSVMRDINSKYDIDPKARTVTNLENMQSDPVYRPVLEYIPEHAAPYNNLGLHFPDYPNVNTGNIKYDQYTDTGYLGLISNSEITSYSNLKNSITMTAGTLVNNDAGWLVFYWHGMLTYIAQKSIAYNISYNNILSLDVMWGYDMGDGAFRKYNFNGKDYRLGVVSGSRSQPIDNNTWSAVTNSTKLVVADLTPDVYLTTYSMLAELLSRIVGGRVSWEETNNNITTEPMWYGGYLDECRSIQYGESWDNLGSKELGICYNVAGTASASISGDLANIGTIMAVKDTDKTINSFYYGYEGAGRVIADRALTYTDTNLGYRPRLSVHSFVYTNN